MLAAELAHIWGTRAGVCPNNLIAKALPAKDSVHKQFQIGVRGVVAVQVDAAVVAQNSAHLYQAHAYPA